MSVSGPVIWERGRGWKQLDTRADWEGGRVMLGGWLDSLTGPILRVSATRDYAALARHHSHAWPVFMYASSCQLPPGLATR